MKLFNKLKEIVTNKRYKPSDSDQDKNRYNSDTNKKHGMWIEGPDKQSFVIDTRDGFGSTTDSFKVWEEGNYENGVRVGQWVGYFEHNSQIAYTNDYVKGDHLGDGSQPYIRKRFYVTGELYKTEEWDFGKNSDDDVNWDTKIFYKSGKLKSEHKVRGKNSKTISYYEDGYKCYESISKSKYGLYSGSVVEDKYFNKKGLMVCHRKHTYKIGEWTFPDTEYIYGSVEDIDKLCNR